MATTAITTLTTEGTTSGNTFIDLEGGVTFGTFEIVDSTTTSTPTAVTITHSATTSTGSNILISGDTGFVTSGNFIITSNTVTWTTSGYIDSVGSATASKEWLAQQAEIKKKREKASKRAEVLLRETLSERQRLELAEKGYFLVPVLGKDGGRRLYQINKGRHGNVSQVDPSGRTLKKFCIHPRIQCPDEDTMLAQKLMLEHQEEEFLKIANHIRVRA